MFVLGSGISSKMFYVLYFSKSVETSINTTQCPVAIGPIHFQGIIIAIKH